MNRECCCTQVIKQIIKHHLWDLTVWLHVLELRLMVMLLVRSVSLLEIGFLWSCFFFFFSTMSLGSTWATGSPSHPHMMDPPEVNPRRHDAAVILCGKKHIHISFILYDLIQHILFIFLFTFCEKQPFSDKPVEIKFESTQNRLSGSFSVNPRIES